MLEHFRQLAGAVDVPVNADFEGGFADDPEGVAENVELAAARGSPGSRSRTRPAIPTSRSIEFELAVERVRAARRAIDESGTGVVLHRPLRGVRRGATRPRGDDPPPGGTPKRRGLPLRTAHRHPEQVSSVVAAVAPKPVNLLVNTPFITVAEAAELGVRRISLGGTLARAARAAFLAATQEIANRARSRASPTCPTTTPSTSKRAQIFAR